MADRCVFFSVDAGIFDRCRGASESRYEPGTRFLAMHVPLIDHALKMYTKLSSLKIRTHICMNSIARESLSSRSTWIGHIEYLVIAVPLYILHSPTTFVTHQTWLNLTSPSVKDFINLTWMTRSNST
jgi:hypothetical protein